MCPLCFTFSKPWYISTYTLLLPGVFIIVERVLKLQPLGQMWPVELYRCPPPSLLTCLKLGQWGSSETLISAPPLPNFWTSGEPGRLDSMPLQAGLDGQGWHYAGPNLALTLGRIQPITGPVPLFQPAGLKGCKLSAWQSICLAWILCNPSDLLCSYLCLTSDWHL